jgi:hypothetical protein
MAHPRQKMNLQNLRTAATRSARSPKVRHEVERLLRDPVLLESCPGAADPKVIREHAVGVMVRISKSEDPYVAFHAANWLRDYAVALEAEQKAKKPHAEKAALLADLRGLYQRALAPAAAAAERVAAEPPEAPLVEVVDPEDLV